MPSPKTLIQFPNKPVHIILLKQFDDRWKAECGARLGEENLNGISQFDTKTEPSLITCKNCIYIGYHWFVARHIEAYEARLRKHATLATLTRYTYPH